MHDSEYLHSTPNDHAELEDLSEISKVRRHEKQVLHRIIQEDREAKKRYMKRELPKVLKQRNSIAEQKKRNANKHQQSKAPCNSTSTMSTTPLLPSVEGSWKENSDLSTLTPMEGLDHSSATRHPSAEDQADTAVLSESKSQ